jgi:conjugal transfer ATP-binding protein TraC
MNIFNLGKKKAKEVVTTPVAAEKPADSSAVMAGKRNFVDGLVSTKDIIAPGSLEVETDFLKIGNKFYRTVFTVINRRFVEINWLSSLINFDASITVSMYIYPTDGKEILDDLRRKITEMEAELTTDIQRGKIVNPATQAKLEDALNLQADLVKGEERFFQMGLYVTMSADTKDDLDRVTKNLESAMGALMVLTKKTSYDSENAFITTLPLAQDRLNLTRNMDTTSLATTFPFVSSDLSDDKGIMFGINEHNGSLVIFDRFSMQNYNMVVFATAGAGKSYMIKLEALRSLMMGTEIIVIDPENEYKDLCDAVGGQYIAFGYGEDSKINPFDLSLVVDDGENALNSKVLTLHKLLKIMLGEMDPIEESILDRAVVDAYKMKGITPDPESQTKEPPLIEDLYKSLVGMEDQKAQTIAARLEKYIKGSFAGIFNQKSTVNLKNEFVVFGIRNLEDTLRPIAMHIILDYIWTIVKKEMRRRILVVDEAWYLMQYPDSAAFLRGIVKRGRKYYLGVTTVTQDVDDFLETPYGKEIVTNSAIQILLKQHSAAIDQIGEVFYLSEGEKQLLLSADKGEGIFFAGQNHVAIRVVASEDEHKLITSNPEEIMKMKAKVKLMKEQGMVVTKPKPQLPKIEDDLNPSGPMDTGPSPLDKGDVQQKIEPVVIPKPTPTIVQNETVIVKPTVDIQKPSTDAVSTTTVSESVKTDQKTEGVLMFKAPTATVGTNVATPIVQVTASELPKTEDILSKRIEEMEALEKTKIEEHKKQILLESETKAKEEAEKKKTQGTLGGFGSLPKYQDLFVNKGKLPPLPPLPKFEPPKAEVVQNEAKPTFVQLPKEEVKIPQPPQLAKKPEPVFVPPTQEVKVEEKKDEVPNKPTMDYDKLFGNGIV